MAPDVTLEDIFPGERFITANYRTLEGPGLKVVEHMTSPLRSLGEIFVADMTKIKELVLKTFLIFYVIIYLNILNYR